MRVLITGAGGFLGTWLAKALAARGDAVTCLLRPGGDASGLEGVAYTRAEGDVTLPATLAAAVAGQDVVFHLAGVRRGATRDDFMRVNAEGTRHLCDAMVAVGHRPRLVLAGSLAACGPSTPTRPHVEEDAFQPYEWYGESKAEAERIAFSYADRLPVTVCRPPRIMGPWDKENLAFFKLAQRGIRLELAGGPRPLTLVDVEDVVALLLLQATHPAALGEAFFCAGRGEPLSLERIQDVGAQALGLTPRTVRLRPGVLQALAAAADGVSRVTGRKLALNRKMARQLLAPAWTCSGAKAERLLGFQPRHDPVESIRRSALWYREKGWL
ncbi:NAD-dependent epimerase/dehydratase family protein [Comamonas sp. JC664]|uniref:NAD-dependent epimerase/dehydratase family protein n=1 Tax=Comamonas sp. JC664 TaxID=2801917 RepID=UPI001749D623|nr:NAD-dependent epimerase/dehydratase family protein [Comamonas sp. JC664]MBL0697852.1 NAD-dependent epimerase/dehydratase family protein [Comamonas sp. JC664]GHG69952.1 NAD-dependent epimerase [Comamonas sp. KCTC 72670]